MKRSTIFLCVSFCTGVIMGSAGQGNAEQWPAFSADLTPPAPDYSRVEYWAALPSIKDKADELPKRSKGLKDLQAEAKADVFFVHPTIYTYEPTTKYIWNGDVTDAELNRKVDESTILNQASVFNAAGKIYAPRYRQAHFFCYYTSQKKDATQAFDLAYNDVKSAFEYYLTHYNQGRPIIIAAHSQGTQHAKRLLKEYFDGKPLHKQLVIAYLIGMPTPANYFKQILPAISPEQTGGFATWCTYAKDYYPLEYEYEQYKSLVVNPLTWDTTSVYAERKLNKGGVGLGYKMTSTGVVDAQRHEGMLWIGKPHILGAGLLHTKNWHVADYNLFWMNVRENAVLRVETFFRNYSGKLPSE